MSEPLHGSTAPLNHARRGPWLLTAALGVGLLLTQLPALAELTGPPPVPTVVVLARADNPVDALAASSAAGALGGSVLLTGSHALAEPAREALLRIDPDLVVLAGGTSALSPAVEQAVQAIPLPTRRVSGVGRIETAAALSALVAELGAGRPLLTGATVAGDAGLTGTLTAGELAGGSLTVESDALVDNLNADLLDGLDSTAFLRGLPARETFELGVLNSESPKSVEVRCDEGEVALGGGHNIGFAGPPFPIAVTMSLPITESGVPVGWMVRAMESPATAADWRPVVAVVCAPAP